MHAQPHKEGKYLLVEGKDDLHATIHILKHHVIWDDDNSPIQLDDWCGVEKILNRDAISAKLKERGLTVLGIIIDADADFQGRWQSIRSICIEFFPNIPEVLPSTGLIIKNNEGVTLGIWIMPDNGSAGILETFLRYLIPDSQKECWEYAISSTETASSKGATYKKTHKDKACIHNWLAWQDEPGTTFGLALKAKILDPHGKYCAPFIGWLINLYSLRLLPAATP